VTPTKAYLFVDSPLRCNPKPLLYEVEVISSTDKSYTVSDPYVGYSKLHRCLRRARKRFAYLTQKDALHAYLKRKQAQHRILKEKLSQTQIFIDVTLLEYDRLYGPPKLLTYSSK
jgi:hypothetical protein